MSSGVRGGGLGGGSPRLEKFRANSVFEGRCKLFKILHNKKYIFNTVNSGCILFLRVSASCSRFWMIKIYISNTVNSRHTLFFRASANCSKFWMINNISMQWKFSRQTLFFRAKRKLFKIMNDKNICIKYKFWAHSVFQGKHKLLKKPECNRGIQYSEKFPGKMFFRASASCSKILWMLKNIFNTVKNFRTNSFFQGKHKLLKILNDKKSVTCRQWRQAREYLPQHDHEMCKTN